jgi:hypothetical protein
MPITLRRWKEKATKYINAKFKKTGEGSLNYDLKVYLEEPAFQPFLNSSVERINHGADENEEIDKAIKHMARQYLAVVLKKPWKKRMEIRVQLRVQVQVQVLVPVLHDFRTV